MAMTVIDPQPSALERSIPSELWQSLPNEPMIWYNRFAQFYLNQPGIKRTLTDAYRDYRISEDNTLERDSIIVSGTWYDAYDRYHWNERALAYDQHLVDQWLDQHGQALLTHRARKLHYWTQIVERASAELARRDVGEMPISVLTRTIKIIDAQINANLPPQPQRSLVIHALHPELQRLILDALSKRK